jgi:hypothetical protein
MKRRTMRYLLVAEAVFCFALPAYFLLWGILTLPLWLLGAGNDATYALIHALCILGGWLGLIALVLVMRYLLRSEPTRMYWLPVLPLVAVGTLSIWTTMTGHFARFELNWFSLLSTIAPTLCAAHLLWLALRRYRSERLGSPGR